MLYASIWYRIIWQTMRYCTFQQKTIYWTMRCSRIWHTIGLLRIGCRQSHPLYCVVFVSHTITGYIVLDDVKEYGITKFCRPYHVILDYIATRNAMAYIILDNETTCHLWLHINRKISFLLRLHYNTQFNDIHHIWQWNKVSLLIIYKLQDKLFNIMECIAA